MLILSIISNWDYLTLVITISCDKLTKRGTICVFLNVFLRKYLFVRSKITILGDSSPPNSFIKPIQKACYVISFVFRENRLFLKIGLVGWWVGGLVGWWVGGLVGWWVGGLVGWWVGGSVGRWVGGLVGWWVGGLVGWWVGGLVGWWVGGLVGWWVGGLVGWWVGGLVGWLVGWLIGWLID